MRVYLLLASASVLAGCGGSGGGVASLASSAVTAPTAGVTPTPSATPTPTASSTPSATPAPTATPTPTATPLPTATPTPTSTPTPTPGVTGNSSTVIAQPAVPVGNSMFDVGSAVAFKAVGGVQALDATTGQVDAKTNPPSTKLGVISTLYAGNASTAAGLGSINYDPRDAIFEVNFADTKAGVTQTQRYQDPAHRTEIGGARSPSAAVIVLGNWNYLTAGSATEESVFFYQRPGNKANYVTLAGYYYRSAAGSAVREIHGAVAFGAPTPTTQIPRTGGGTYNGEFLATMVGKNVDDPNSGSTSFQWIKGDSAVTVDFARATVGVQLEGNVTDGRTVLGETIANDQLLVRGGSSFSAKADAKLDLASGTFAGKFNTATFGSINGAPLDFAAITPGSSTAGASSVDGLFYGPVADEVGGSFRIIGGRPDQRVDVLGAFTAKKLAQ